MAGEKETETGDTSGDTSGNTSNNKEPLHQAYTVTNVQTKVRTLDGKKITYTQWVKLFKLHVKAFKVYDHIDGTPPPQETDPTYAQWATLDSLVVQWIYATISDDIFARVLEDETTARAAWLKIEEVFLSNKNARAAALENEFTKQTLTGCGGLDEYCQKLKDIAGQLGDVGHPVTESRLVLQLVRGLPTELDTIGTLINQKVPSWEEARNDIQLEQQRQAARSTNNPRESALVHSQSNPTDRVQSQQQQTDNQRPQHQSNYRGNNYDPNYRGPQGWTPPFPSQ
ncbi:hypothetical protein QVD17_00841 [Tagetes erecta]|uniref:Retrotransposon gag domain-containing protein n=1 Tax=Tagetes erecta TaxID=13708 RepID=A0AAD8L9J0_TARER|nr:hypothetical protein QVD17_00841 [Tagetes erecta]